MKGAPLALAPDDSSIAVHACHGPMREVEVLYDQLLAEIAAGSIAMGLGGFLAAKSDAEHYEQELAREKKEIGTIPEAEASEVSEVFESYGLTKEESQPIVAALRQKLSR